MQNLFPVIVLGSCALLGGGAGFAAKALLAPAPVAAGEHAAVEADGHSRKQEPHGAEGGHGESAAPAFIKFSRQFVVPASPGSNRALMIVDLNIEVTADVGDGAYALEPKLRAACLAALLALSAEGRLADVMGSAEAAAEMRARLLDAARSVLGEGALDVLVTDIAVQDV